MGLDPEKTAVVACGTVRPELTDLAKQGFLNRERLLFATPGLHERMPLLEEQLKKRLETVKNEGFRVIVVYGKLCYVDMSNPYRAVDALCEEVGDNISRVQADNCVDMIADSPTREQISGDSKVYWLTPGWILHWNSVFYQWDHGKYNETFGRFDKAVLLDTVGLYDELSETDPEKLLEISDLMGIPLETQPASLERFKSLLVEAEDVLKHLNSGEEER